jgi:hypothetical protein
VWILDVVLLQPVRAFGDIPILALDIFIFTLGPRRTAVYLLHVFLQRRLHFLFALLFVQRGDSMSIRGASLASFFDQLPSKQTLNNVSTSLVVKMTSTALFLLVFVGRRLSREDKESSSSVSIPSPDFYSRTVSLLSLD